MAEIGSDEHAVRLANDDFYKALAAGSIDGISAACAHDDDVTALHEASKEVAIGWPAVLDTWKAIPFDAFSQLSVVMPNPAIKVSGLIARVAGLEDVKGKMKDGKEFAWTGLGTNIYEKRDGKWLMVHHHASKATEELLS